MLLISNIKLEISDEVQELKRTIKSRQQTTQQNRDNQPFREVMAWLT